MTTEEKLREFVAAELIRDGSRAEVTSELALLDLLDSLKIMETVSFIESEFKIRVDDDELVPGNFETLAVLSAFVEAKRGS
jgi:acyl carrier protein